MAEPTTPTGLTASQAEALSSQQQPNYTYAPTGGVEYFSYEGDVYAIKNGKIYALDYNNEDFAPGMSGSDKRAASYSWAKGVLGNIPEKNIAFVVEDLSKQQGVGGQQVMGGMLQKANFFTATPQNYATAQPAHSGDTTLAKDIVYPNNPPGQQTAGNVDQSATPTTSTGSSTLGTQTGQTMTFQEASQIAAATGQLTGNETAEEIFAIANAAQQGGGTLATQTGTTQDPYAGVRAVFGQTWEPSPAFINSGLVNQGIYGAVRVTDSANPNQVYLIGPGGYPIESEEQFASIFGTTNQQGIVGTVTMQDAVKLGINPADFSGDMGGGNLNTGTITNEDLTGDVNNIELPDVTDDNTGAEELFAAEKTITDLIQKGYQDILDQIAKGREALQKHMDEGEAIFDYQKQLEEQVKLDEKAQQVTDYTNEILAMQAQFEEIKKQEDNAKMYYENRPITMAAMTGAQAQIERQYAIKKNQMASEIGIKQASLLAAQNNLTLAQSMVDKAVNLKWKKYEMDINNHKALLEILYDELDFKQKQQADAINLALTLQQRDIDAQKEREKTILSYYNTAVAGGAPQSVLNQIMDLYENNGSVADAARIAGVFGAEAPESRVIQIGNQNVTQEWRNGKWVEVSRGNKWEGSNGVTDQSDPHNWNQAEVEGTIANAIEKNEEYDLEHAIRDIVLDPYILNKQEAIGYAENYFKKSSTETTETQTSFSQQLQQPIPFAPNYSGWTSTSSTTGGQSTSQLLNPGGGNTTMYESNPFDFGLGMVTNLWE
ncbi:MAG: hypothetical protein VKN72_05685 [Nostocales cyanobacterium 94392]|nr:hypothetical protein [Nostocales cyanobacterium 94392]